MDCVNPEGMPASPNSTSANMRIAVAVEAADEAGPAGKLVTQHHRPQQLGRDGDPFRLNDIRIAGNKPAPNRVARWRTHWVLPLVRPWHANCACATQAQWFSYQFLATQPK